MIKLKTPITNDDIKKLKIEDKVLISGEIYTGRDAVLPKLVKLVENGDKLPFSLERTIFLHTAVSEAGISPTSSNKDEIESSIKCLSNAGVKIFIGKGSLSEQTMKGLKSSIFIVTPSVAGLLTKTVLHKEIVSFKEEGIEAIFRLIVKDFPGLVATTKGESIFT
ncbi:MAG: fumarate hydratase C-terminal domain-containing protein [Methanobrevibacter sp.]|jgi:fumarate hydratase subunit beta|nr:fumarate hydratase C-terminal domain-containing protein [Candidatus Methanovirga basalitermitum]